MKTTKSKKRASTKKRKGAPKNFAAYLETVPKPAQAALLKMRGVIRSALPQGVTETISYGIPAFRSEKGVLIWFAAFSDHCSLFPTAAVIAAFQKQLKGFSTSKGTVHFPLDKPLPVLLIRRLVKARVKQNENKKQR